ncbi:general secretion pathway protein GspE [Erwinia typographi]|uniref:Type II secretion system protein E n=1 Tax=Erwinia typographi TaxID=371042 RepID=A0A0A3Z9T3_9GAMM|nr:type II secretion system ATPase GspE [Erwinia typographi]KGT94401.1 general secretion pathway protein GspE [Erwinia typographi]
MDDMDADTLTAMLPFSWVKQYGVLVTEQQGAPCVMCRENVAVPALMEAQRLYPSIRALSIVSESVFEHAVTEVYQNNAGVMANIGSEIDFYALAEEIPAHTDLLDGNDDAPIIRLINAMLGEAIKEAASDVHIEPFEKRLLIRFRVDGILHNVLEPQRQLASLLVSRIKVMAKLDIAEKRIPQDGRIALRIAGRAVDVRVSTLPTQYGERVVMRLLDKNNARLTLSHAGMSEACREGLTQLVHQPHGLVLVTGPTGSGKSTTLYSALNEIDSSVRNVMTVEDPIEYELDGIGQTQVNSKVDMTFARGLRALLRQDPDVVLVGEIRDPETAQVAVQASMTGHLVLSTLHTNTAVGAITRLQDMGIEPFLLATTLAGVLSQRLVRTLCTHCCVQSPASEEERLMIGSREPALLLARAVGCEHCKQTGYRGRTGIHELIVLDPQIRSALSHGSSEQEIDALVHQKTATLRQDGMNKVVAGLTTLEEVTRVTREA